MNRTGMTAGNGTIWTTSGNGAQQENRHEYVD